MVNPAFSRRTFLRASGVALSLPWLESMQPADAAGTDTTSGRRMVAINVELGLHAANVTPQQAGRGYQLSPYLKFLEKYRDQFTYISGASHP
ncbi:MAG: DUF1552 domain-containing protein, partial [Planctomycetaceae bacterium]